MRVIAGTCKGHLLQAPRGVQTRPTSDRARTIMFDLLQGKVSGAYGVDLFAGSGALGIEALSRGAQQFDFVEKNRRAVEFIRRNLSHTHLENHAQVMVADAFAFLNRAAATAGRPAYDLLFADPPYNFGHAGRLLDTLANSRLLNAGAIAVLEETARLELKPEAGRLRCYLRRLIGETALHFYEVS